MMRRLAVSVLPILLAVGPSWLTAPASAHCILVPGERVDWSGFSVVPVRLGVAGSSCDYHFAEDPSWSAGALRRWLEGAIAEINAASHGGPRLYYAGTDTVNCIDSSDQMANSIVVTAGCGSGGGGTGIWDAANKKVRTWIKRGDQGCGDTFYWWTDPQDDDQVGTDASYDVQGVLVHELLHAMGLGHPDIADADAWSNCDLDLSESSPGGTAPEAQASVLWTVSKDHRRWLRRDDVEGLRKLYAGSEQTGPERPVLYRTNTSSTASSGSWSASAPVTFKFWGLDFPLESNTPVGAGGSSRQSYDDFEILGYTGGADLVQYVWGTWAAWQDAQFLKDTNNLSVRTFDPVSVAHGIPHGSSNPADRRLIAVWTGRNTGTCCDAAGEHAYEQSMRIWWRVKAGATWKPLPNNSAPVTKYKTHGVAYDPRTDMFVLAYIDEYPTDAPKNAMVFVRTIDATTGGGGCTQALTTVDPVHEVGDIACDYYQSGTTYTNCTIPVATTTEDGPALMFLEGEIQPYMGGTCWIRTVDPPRVEASALSYGFEDLVMDGSLVSATRVLGARVKGLPSNSPNSAAYSYLYTMTRSGGILEGGLSNEIAFESGWWPLAVSSLSRDFSPFRQWRVYHY